MTSGISFKSHVLARELARLVEWCGMLNLFSFPLEINSRHRYMVHWSPFLPLVPHLVGLRSRQRILQQNRNGTVVNRSRDTFYRHWPTMRNLATSSIHDVAYMNDGKQVAAPVSQIWYPSYRNTSHRKHASRLSAHSKKNLWSHVLWSLEWEEYRTKL